MPQPKRMRSCHAPSGSTTASGSGPTEPSKSRTTGAVIRMSLVPGAVSFEVGGKPPQNGAQQTVADMDGVTGEGKAGTEIGLDLRVGPAGDIVGQAALQRVGEVVEPTDEVKVQRTRLWITKADVFVDEHFPIDETHVVSDQAPAVAVLENDAAAGGVLQ